jgi:hypothetical protein
LRIVNPGARSCYEGYNGYNFALHYEPVLAAADGVVLWSKYNIPNCHNGGDFWYEIYVWIPDNLGYSNNLFTMQAIYTAIIMNAKILT